MNQIAEQPAATPAPIIVNRPSRGPAVVALFALLLSIIAFAGALALWNSYSDNRRKIEDRLSDTRHEISDSIRPSIGSLTQRQDEISLAAGQLQQRQKVMDEQLTQAADAVTKLSGMVQGGRRTWQLYEVEYLLLTANDRLQLQHDVQGALRALEAASQRIAQVSDPLLTGVREKIIQEVAALRAVPAPDYQQIILSLATLESEVPTLPLQFSVPDKYERPKNPEDKMAEPEGRWDRFVRALRKALRGLANIRREGRPLEPLLPPEQEFFLYQNLTLKLETARLAVLQRDTETYRTSIASARSWLEQFYAQKNPQVVAAIRELAALEHEQLAWPLPDISGSLDLLRKQMEVRKLAPTQLTPVEPEAKPAPDAKAEPKKTP
jgi:uroporphyrin-3 C-methyltransferase